MHIPDNVICKVCSGVFCCSECRRKHEIKNHAIPIRKPKTIDSPNVNKTAESSTKSENQFETIYMLCPICDKRPLPLQAEMPNEILMHIESNHLPLRCGKCLKIYYNIDDLKEFTKCFQLTAMCAGLESNSSCHTNELSKVTVTKAIIPHGVTIAQNSPMYRQDFNESHMTPISIINMRWKAKSKLTHEEIIGDSVSSIKNISSINNSSIRHTMGSTSEVKGKVIRCSSTPVHFEMLFSKPKEQTFNASSGGHISSIQYNSGCESDISPAFAQPNTQALERNRYIKVPGARSKISAVTPLHQVMSKSIQKAFAEHGLPSTSIGVRGFNAHQRKNMFDSTSSPDINITESPQPPALDLRLSPAIRRSQSEGEEYKEQRSKISGIAKKHTTKDLPNFQRKIILSAQKLTTESIVITRTEHMSTVSSSISSAATSNGSINSVKPISSTNSSYQSAASNNSGGSVFKSCSSVEIIRATTEQIQTLESDNAEVYSTLSPFTPITRVPGPPIIQKKLIKFDTPDIKLSDVRKPENSPSEMFFTPNATPMPNEDNKSTEVNKERKLLVKQNLYGRFSPLRRPSIKECAHSTAFSRIDNITNDFDDDPTANVGTDYDDEVFLAKQMENTTEKISANKKTNESQQSSGLWSLMTSMMRLPSRIASQSKDDSKKTDSYATVDTNSIMKRCASIAGCLVRSKPLVDESELRSLKRKRTYTTDNQINSTFLSQYNNSITTSPTSDNFNISSKRFRIQGRRPIDRMRLNS